MTPAECFEKHALPADFGCWEWDGHHNDKGYAIAYPSGMGDVRAHRIAYEMFIGPIPEGMEPDHLCSNTGCVNPWHLEVVTHLENVRRGRAGEWQRLRTHCPQDHPYDADNTYITVEGYRQCKTCKREKSLARYHRRAG